MFSKEFGAKARRTVRNKYQIQLKKKGICCRKNPEAATIGVLYKMTCKGQHRCFTVNVVKFLRTSILKNICKPLLLKISTPAANLAKGGISWFYYPFNILMILLCNMLCEDISLKHDIFITKHKWDVIISSSCRLLLKVRIWYRCQNRIEISNQHDGEQLGFYKKVRMKRQHRAGCSLHCKKRRIPIYLAKTVLKRTSIPYSTWRKLT